MGLSSSIQFWEVDSVLQAFNNRRVEAWSINCGKQFMFKGIGEDELKNILDQLSRSNSAATYTLKIYEEIEDPTQIKSNTPDDGSFNFKFNQELQNRYSSIRERGFNPGDENVILSKLQAIEERLNAEEEEEENNYGLGKIGQVLQHPTIQQIAPGIIQKLLSAILGEDAAKQIPGIASPGATIGAVPTDQNLFDVVNELKKHDPDLYSHLQKLLAIAQQQPETFKMFLNYLN